MTHASLFSGIGGFDLAAQRVGWHNVFHCEINPFCQQVLKYYWPKAITYGDIKKTDFTAWRGAVDVLSGGFPCQPYSTAGKRLGKDDERHLWPEMLRAIREIAPRWVVGENVRGFINWNGGLVFDEVQADLEAEGYEVLPFLLPACGVGAPHERYRIWFVAYAGGNGHELRGFGENRPPEGQGKTEANKWQLIRADIGRACKQGHAANSNGSRLERLKEVSPRKKQSHRDPWHEFPTQPPVCGRNDGLPVRLDGITFPKWREESIRGFGNAIVPKLAMQIFFSIQKYHQ